MNVRSRLPLLSIILLVVGCQRLTNPAAYHFDQAQALVDAGKWEEANTALQQVKKDYPQSPEAGKVQGALNEMYFKRAKSMWDAGQYLDAGRGYMLYATSDGVTDAESRDPMLFLAANYAANRGESPLTDDGLTFAMRRRV